MNRTTETSANKCKCNTHRVIYLRTVSVPSDMEQNLAEQNRHIIHGDMKETASECFFLNRVYYTARAYT